MLPRFAAGLARALFLSARVVSACASASCAVALGFAPFAARADALSEDERMTLAGGAWQPGKVVPCADGVVDAVHPRLDEGNASPPAFDSGVVVEIRLPNAPKFLNGQAFPAARVVHYQQEPRNALMRSERPGDRVQVCLVSFPTPTHDPHTGQTICNPNIDPRGIVYRVYDYKRKAAYLGPDSQHGCGGA